MDKQIYLPDDKAFKGEVLKESHKSKKFSDIQRFKKKLLVVKFEEKKCLNM